MITGREGEGAGRDRERHRLTETETNIRAELREATEGEAGRASGR